MLGLAASTLLKVRAKRGNARCTCGFDRQQCRTLAILFDLDHFAGQSAGHKYPLIVDFGDAFGALAKALNGDGADHGAT
ncbi:hypothetical protein PSQ90_08295 [Devosia rhodophyticola]|uniref:Uncharacterized protein n=1 Tax=Devosia rhodophyticola TaxID=3026423 RepID=A0ABY7Z2S8_9HYPH|nr:hypothetical protein [Devosia rhodophyticola]WDR07404.1 hypothetical protein PSQ90_08295 [Devosia rhodophyticola]